MPLLLGLIAVAIQAPTLSVSFPPTPIGKALAILSKATHQRLEVSSALSGEVIVANLTDAPVDRVLKEVADLFCAKWSVQSDGTKSLTPDPIAQKKRDGEEAAKGEAALDRSLQYLAKRLGEQPAEYDDKTVHSYKLKLAAEEARRKEAEAKEDWEHAFLNGVLTEESPGWRALARALPLIGKGAMLQMPFRATEVWAEKPTHVQHAMPEGVAEVLSQYRREMNLVDPSLNVARIKVAILRWEQGTAFSGQLEALDASGTVIDTATARLNDDSELMKIPYSQRNQYPAKPGEKPLAVSEDCLDARLALSRSMDANPRRGAALRLWRPKMEDPTHFEPTTWYVGADLRTAAAEADKELIGAVSDDTTGGNWKPEQVTPSQLLATHAADFLPSTDGWLIYRMHEHVTRASRSEGQSFIRHSLQEGGVSVDDAAAWVTKTDDLFPFGNWFGDYLHVLFPGRGPYSALSTMLDAIGLRLWNSLGESNLTNLKGGATIRLSDLTSDTKSQIAKIVYWYHGLDAEKADPTDVLPDGIHDGSLTMTVFEKPVIFGWPAKDGPPVDPMPIDAKQFGQCLAKGNTYWEMPAEVFRAWDTFRIGTHREYELHFVLQPGSLPMTESLNETFFDPSAQQVDKLPEAIQKEVDAARAAEAAKPKKTQTKDVIPPR